MSLAAYHEEMQHNVDQATSIYGKRLSRVEIQNVELDLAKKRAQEAARIKSEFLAPICLTSCAPAQWGDRLYPPDAENRSQRCTQRDHLTTIERSANNLLAIINDVLDFSKLEAGKLIPGEYSVPAATSGLMKWSPCWRIPAHDKGLELTLNIKNNVPDNVIGDPLRLQQIVTNLVGNTPSNLPEHGNIDVLVESSGPSVIPGYRSKFRSTIPASASPSATQSRLFQAFRQADASISAATAAPGSGW